MNKLDSALFNCEQIRQCETLMQTRFAVSEDELMELAGQAAFHYLKERFPSAHKILVFCGAGKNAGDGYVLARLAYAAGYDVQVNQYKSTDQLPLIAQNEAYAAQRLGVPFNFMEEHIDNDVDLIVDALLGTGIKDAVREPLSTAISLINDSDIPVLALDIPSGLQSDTGAVLGDCVYATATISFIGKKIGLYTADGPDYCGEIIWHDLQTTPILTHVRPAVRIIEGELINDWLRPRKLNCHKGDFGHVLIVGGGVGMPGAVCIAAEAALRVGAGLVTVATRPEYSAQVLNQVPEALVFGIEKAEQILSLLKKATVCVIGPGLGLDNWSRELFAQVMASHLPMVIDASALRLLALHPQQDDNWILTPHPGEAAALLQCPTEQVMHNRLATINHLQHAYGGYIVLKGLGTLVKGGDESQIYLSPTGNPGMASAGMGDALTGIIGGLIAQQFNLAQAALTGVWLHGAAGDLAAQEAGEKGLLASDLMPFIRLLVNKKIKYDADKFKIR